MIDFNYIRQNDQVPMAHVRITFSLDIASFIYAGMIISYEALLDGGDPAKVARKLTPPQIEAEIRTQLLLFGDSEWSRIDDFDDYDEIEQIVKQRVHSLWPRGVRKS